MEMYKEEGMQKTKIEQWMLMKTTNERIQEERENKRERMMMKVGMRRMKKTRRAKGEMAQAEEIRV
jgi:hypothetical protein